MSQTSTSRGKRQDYFILNEQGLQIWNSYLNRMLSKGIEPHQTDKGGSQTQLKENRKVSEQIFTPLVIKELD